MKNSPLGSVGSQALSLAIGSSLIGIAVGLLVQARLGLTPYDMLSSAIEQKSGLSLGQAGWALAAALFTIAMLLGQRPNKWGVTYILLNGLTIDAASGLLTTPDTLLGRSVFVGAATIVMALGVTIVVESGTSGGPFELLVRAGQERGLNRAATRSCLDAFVFLLGLALGGSFGFATIVYAMIFGAILEAVRQAHNDLRTGRRARISNLMSATRT